MHAITNIQVICQRLQIINGITRANQIYLHIFKTIRNQFMNSFYKICCLFFSCINRLTYTILNLTFGLCGVWLINSGFIPFKTTSDFKCILFQISSFTTFEIAYSLFTKCKVLEFCFVHTSCCVTHSFFFNDGDQINLAIEE